MFGEMSVFFSRMIGTAAVILVVASFIGISDVVSDLRDSNKKWLYYIITGVLGGVLGMYGNISGFELDGAVISVRDIGPMFAGFIGGPIGGLIAGIIAGLHRFTMGGVTANACIVATVSIGLICGFVSIKWHKYIKKTALALILGALMEVFHLCVVLIMVKPFETAAGIVRAIAIPFITVNALGFALMIIIINYTEKQHNFALERSRLKSELEVANVIQHSLLPMIGDEYPGCKNVEVSGSMDAAKEVGGDFYDVFYVDPAHLAFVIGDVSGKGVPAALFMASSKIILQNCIRDIPSISDAVTAANNALCARNEAGMFVTLWVGILDFKSGELKFVSAGHNPPVLLRKDEPEFLKCKNGFVLGGMEGIKYRENTAEIQDGDILYLYTDGVTEAEDHEHNLFGDERLLGCLKGRSNSTSSDILANVKTEIDAFVKGNSQFDDITMLCFKWKKLSE